MNKRLIALASLALVSGWAAAQSSVTVYGIVDVGLLTSSRSAAGGSTTSMASGGIAPSIWGFRGTEDLGNGLKATFNLEGHLDASTGADVGPQFRRQSNLGLSSPEWGSVTLGNQYSPAVLAFAATDPRGLRENFSGLYPWAYNSGALTTGNNTNNDVGVFMQNAVTYSNTLGPVNLGVSYSLEKARGGVLALGVTYRGPVTVSAAYQATNLPGTTSRQSTLYTLGAAYAMGDITGKVNYLRGVNKNAALVETSDVGVFGLGLDWKTSANNTVMAAIYLGKNKTNSADKTTTLVVADEYALSKRTTVYGQAAFAKARSGATLLTTAVAGGTVANATTTQLNVGIKHAF